MTRISINSLCNPDSPSSRELDHVNHSEQHDSLNQDDTNLSTTKSTATGAHFIDRVSSLPVVNTALRAYEQTKANNSVVKYGAETVENSVKSICRPVISKIEPQLAGLDEFACRQLDRIQSHYSSYMDPNANNEVSNDQSTHNPEDPSTAVSYSYNSNQDDSTLRRRQVATYSQETASPQHQETAYQTQVAESQQPTRSRWQQVVHEAGVTAGAGVALFSDESMKMLKYCLEWLQYSSNHIQEQLNLLNNYLVSILPQSRSNEVQTYQATRFFVSAIKKEVVTTLKKIVDILSLYAGNCLPGDARNMVKNFILGLPSRWAALNTTVGVQSHHSAADCDTPTPCSSPLLTPSANSPQFQAQRDQTQGVITLATESLNMINNVTDVFKQTVERAEGWMSAVGMQPTQLPPLSLPSQHPGYSTAPDFTHYHLYQNSTSSNSANLASFSLNSHPSVTTGSNPDAMDTTD